MTQRTRLGAAAASVCLVGALLVAAENKKAQPQESERKVQESEVPAPALAALKKLSGGAAIHEYAEEIEHGHKFYEGSWKSADGHVDGLVTEAGDVVEIEEGIPSEKAPASVRAAFKKTAGNDTPVKIERKTFFVYEGHFKKDGKGHEVIFTPDGRRYYEEGQHEGGKEEDGDKDDDKEDENK